MSRAHRFSGAAGVAVFIMGLLLSAPTKQDPPEFVTKPPAVQPSTSPAPTPTANPWDCEAKRGSYQANAPREQKLTAHSLGRKVDIQQPAWLLVQDLHTALCGNIAEDANRSLAATFDVKFNGGNPNRELSFEQWSAQAKQWAAAIMWDKISVITNYPITGRTHYTVAAIPNRGPPEKQPTLYMTYVPHKVTTVVAVPVRIGDHYDSVLLTPECGWQFLIKEMEYAQWIRGVTNMRTRVS